MNGANHRMDSPSTFPFPIMGGSWAEHFDLISGLPGRGDAMVGHDAWFGYQAMVMPGARIGHGAVIAAGSVVTGEIPDHGIAGGNPARLIRRRYSDDVPANRSGSRGDHRVVGARQEVPAARGAFVQVGR